MKTFLGAFAKGTVYTLTRGVLQEIPVPNQGQGLNKAHKLETSSSSP